MFQQLENNPMLANIKAITKAINFLSATLVFISVLLWVIHYNLIFWLCPIQRISWIKKVYNHGQ